MPRPKTTNNAPEQQPIEQTTTEQPLAPKHVLANLLDANQLPEQFNEDLLTKHYLNEFNSKRERLFAATEWKKFCGWLEAANLEELEKLSREFSEINDEPEEEENNEPEMSEETLNHIRYGENSNVGHTRLNIEAIADLLEDVAGALLLSGVTLNIEGDANILRLLDQRLQELQAEEDA